MKALVLMKKTLIKFLIDFTAIDLKNLEHSGLGLNIVKNIVELHGGSIVASNKHGNKKGARIEVLLPIYK